MTINNYTQQPFDNEHKNSHHYKKVSSDVRRVHHIRHETWLCGPNHPSTRGTGTLSSRPY